MKPLLAPLTVCLIRCLALLILLTAPVQAQGLERDSIRLSSFTPQAGPVRLTDVTSAVDLFIPVSDLVTMHDARVELRFVHSIALLAERSFLLVRMNDITIAQISVDPLQPRGTARFMIPDDLWQSGFNRLSIGVIQHY
ncbi:celB protein [Ectothiorhodospira sp. PHS-1]|uniref:cellulose biosynthesis cyclic di-GMP-binding regulatory protein BcsB n=1 Tax=Ectothiorhodospira sp. PHS-1 TaxID=519989 RepID=UPI00024A83D7|nr:cellulose biosynthesis cyclic di-GMP-binding regulatory protein BcsB [Ectothiorhodospira sp. PHS-1]EHQ53354.1 celB protein [Ectothiorhodospira sp. PHS-1]